MNGSILKLLIRSLADAADVVRTVAVNSLRGCLFVCFFFLLLLLLDFIIIFLKFLIFIAISVCVFFFFFLVLL